jgi:hypothetical protein
MAAAFPLATVLYYGPDDRVASKCVITVYVEAGVVSAAKTWQAEEGDVRRDAALADEMVAFVKLHGVRNTVFGEGIWGCPHEAGIDFPAGDSCGECAYWAGRERGGPADA